MYTIDRVISKSSIAFFACHLTLSQCTKTRTSTLNDFSDYPHSPRRCVIPLAIRSKIYFSA